MPVNPAAENVLATIGTIMWMIQLVPQILKSYREKSTEGLSPWLVFIWALSAPFLGVYMIAQNINIPLILQPQLFGAMSALSWIQLAGFEGGFAILVRHKYRNGDVWSLRALSLISSVLLSAGLIPQYWEIWKRKEVVGVSILFMVIDMLGGMFSALSLVFKEPFDTFAAVPYLLVVILDALVILSAVILNPLARWRRRRQETSGSELANQECMDTTANLADEHRVLPPANI